MTRPQVALIITCHNLGRTLDEALASVLTQTRRPDELLIVDDGSTDIYTRQALVRLEKAGYGVVHTPTPSVSAARNLGIRSTVSPYLVLLEADHVLDPTYLERASAQLDQRDVAFVSWEANGIDAAAAPKSGAPDLIQLITRESIHLSSMFRRDAWVAVGGFDEDCSGVQTLHFWTSVLEHGFAGAVLSEPALVRPLSTDGRPRGPDAHVAVMERFYRKHAGTITQRAEGLLVAKERFLLEQREQHEQSLSRRNALQQELEAIHRQIDETVRDLQALGGARVDFGDLRRTSPVSRVWGLDRGIPLDRYYINAFLDRHREDIHGRVLEVKDAGYTTAFGGDRVTVSDVLDIDADNPLATIVTDLTRADGIADDTYDCFVLTQTLGVIYDVGTALANAHRVLKAGGVLLCTMPASGRISYEGPGLDGDYWRFTEASIRRLFAEVFPVDAFEVTGFGNVLGCTAFLYGLAPNELTQDELDWVDPFFPVVYGVRAVKPS